MRSPNRFLNLALTAGGLLTLALLPADAAAGSFDSGLEGWGAAGFEFETLGPSITSLTLVAIDDMDHELTEGNPGGYARFPDRVEDIAAFARAPASFTGDLTDFIGGSFSFDHRLFDVGINAQGISPYSVIFLSGDPIEFEALVWTAPAPGMATDWQHFEFTLDESNLVPISSVSAQVFDPTLPDITLATLGYTTDMSFGEIMANVTDVLIGFELVNNGSDQLSEHGGIDNVFLTALPEPASLALLLMAATTLARRRR